MTTDSEGLLTAVCRCPPGVRLGLRAAEWAIIELQGSLSVIGDTSALTVRSSVDEQEAGTEEPKLDGQDLGMLTFENGQPVLEIGAHRLEGKIVPIKKPFAVLHRREGGGDDDMDDGKGEGAAEGCLGADADVDADATFDVRGIVRHKLLFKTRPKPLINQRE